MDGRLRPYVCAALCPRAGFFRGMGRLPRLLGVRLELLFQRRELGKRRIRIGLLVAAVPALAASLDILGTQRRSAILTIPAPRPVRAGPAVAHGAATLRPNFSLPAAQTR